MNKYKTKTMIATVALLALAGQAGAEGNRYGKERSYAAEISATQAYLNAVVNSGSSSRLGRAFGQHVTPMIIDVRSVTEYADGHPEGALSIPYPHIFGSSDAPDYIPQPPEAFVAAVMAEVPNLDTPIYTLCRTGSRSISAANLLAEAGYTNVYNIWEGFVGRYKQDTNGEELDLDNSGELDDGDLDGWSRFQGLPYSTELNPSLLYWPYMDLYYRP